jgi:hypothetical protein
MACYPVVYFLGSLAESVDRNTIVLLRLLNKVPSFPHVSGGEVVHGRTVHEAKDANPVKQWFHSTIDIVPVS